MDNIAGQKTSLGLVTNLTVLVLVILWLIPTIGLLVSSFRDRDQISESGWWEAPFPVEQVYRTRAAVEGATETPNGWVVEGNIFDTDDLREAFASGEGTVTAFGDSGRAPTEYPVGEAADLGDGETLLVNADGSFVYTTPEEPTRGPRLYFGAEAPPEFTLDNYDTVLTSAGMGQAFINTFTVTIPATVIPILIAAFAAYALAWMDFAGRGILIAAVVGLLVVPLQLALVPMLTFHNEIGVGQSFLGIWMAHTGLRDAARDLPAAATTWSACRATSSRAPRWTAPPTSRCSPASSCP